jgi:predicted dehydrogenase
MKVQYRVGDMYAPKLEDHEALKFETDHFVDCLNNGTQPLTGGREGLQIVKILTAAEQSLKNKGAPVELV